MVSTFFGHRQCPDRLQEKLQKAVIELIENQNVTKFYVGNQGEFDRLVRTVLKRIKAQYPFINYAVVLAYMPTKITADDYSDTIYPDGFENIPPRYAIIQRNRWMLERSDCVITYVRHNVGGAARYREIAEKQGKIIIDL